MSTNYQVKILILFHPLLTRSFPFTLIGHFQFKFLSMKLSLFTTTFIPKPNFFLLILPSTSIIYIITWNQTFISTPNSDSWKPEHLSKIKESSFIQIANPKILFKSLKKNLLDYLSLSILLGNPTFKCTKEYSQNSKIKTSSFQSRTLKIHLMLLSQWPKLILKTFLVSQKGINKNY